MDHLEGSYAVHVQGVVTFAIWNLISDQGSF